MALEDPSVEATLMVLRCSECGDTFSYDGGDTFCPSCGGTEVDPASEPLL